MAETTPRVTPPTPLRVNPRQQGFGFVGTIVLDFDNLQWTYTNDRNQRQQGPWAFTFNSSNGAISSSMTPPLVIPQGELGGNHGPYTRMNGIWDGVATLTGTITRTGVPGPDGGPRDEDVEMRAGGGGEPVPNSLAAAK